MTMSAIAIGGSAVLGFMGAQSGSDAASKQQQQNQQAQIAWNKQQDPFSAGGSRQQYVGQLNQLMQGGISGIEQDPNFKAELQAGQENVQRGMSARGQGGSGQEMLALQEQGMGSAEDYFNRQYQRLSQLSGASRGGGQAPMGQSPQAAYGQATSTATQEASAFGGLASIFGKGAGGGGGAGTSSWSGTNAPVSNAVGMGTPWA